MARPKRRHHPVDPRVAALHRARAAAERNYRRYPNVVGVGAGRKFRRRGPTDEIHCIQFFVSRKYRDPEAVGRSLPGFVYGRRRDGSVDRSVRFDTDVIQVGRVEPACAGGSELDSETGQFGGITLVFENRVASPAGSALMLTCAHVVGDLSEVTPPDPEVESPCCRHVKPIGSAILSSVRRGRSVEFDVALVRISQPARERCALRFRETSDGTALDSYFPTEAIDPELQVECDFPISGARTARVDGFQGAVQMTIHGRECTVRNAFLLRANVRRGDSGGLVFRGGSAVGILFGRSSGGFGWFHALEGAVAHLQASDPDLAFEVF